MQRFLSLFLLSFVFTQALFSLELSSPDFRHRSYMPKHLSAFHQNISPELNIADVPDDCRSLVLIMEAPDASDKDKVHWLMYNINPKTQSIPKGRSSGMLGLNDFKKSRYMGPKPPSGTHRYLFKLYALDTTLPIAGSITRNKIKRMMKGHILEETVLIGLFKNENTDN
ncbi:MAG: YbhB/YbcL family Raf kinase inhibitor-like protein [Chlamydiales bacterium]|nr:YbhB/YbcL family Raf kinase inhibitor-like protein [Chlamydiales bacterium]NCF71234.1 YbhB/YbcL family Raf kinase inhibitor-like protein [Chlamydiales bacterium]